VLPRQERLTRSGEFTEVYRSGRRYAGIGLAVYVLPGKTHTRVGFRIPRRVGTAVVRNRVRRRLREAYRQVRGEIPGGWHVVIVVREQGTEMGMLELREALRGLLRRAGADAHQ